jgi:hypothetical protein
MITEPVFPDGETPYGWSTGVATEPIAARS